MKIETNFTFAIRPFVNRVRATTVAVVPLLVICGVLVFIDAASRSSAIDETKERLTQLDARRAALGALPPLPSVAELERLKSRVAAINELSVTKGRRIVPLLVVVEELLPSDAWLVRLNYKAREGETVLVAEAERAETLAKLLVNLERSLRFSEVLLVRQAPQGIDGRRSVQFEIRLREHQ